MTIADLVVDPAFYDINGSGDKGLVYAVDRNQTMLNALKENIAKSEVNQNIIKIVNSDVCHTGILKESVDFVLFANFLHEVEDKKTLREKVRRRSFLS